ncbi:unnamed protein product [Echinostoma caproni]|uniref:Transposase n=1 Tax=Echinostoma caproni TaxID=27848 RepID=A0A183A2I6_9TREM|nr:unnamed protein product [Echinostoma caproni]
MDAGDLQHRVCRLNWLAESAQEGVQDQWERVMGNLLELTNQAAPEKRVRRRGKLPWWRARIDKAMREKDTWQRYRSSGCFRAQ